MGWLRGAALPL
uniref:Uncharacterized protein n=1 Tax=Arundo donax TaxID=35708 RepID=A0A0A9I3E8_ARUDO